MHRIARTSPSHAWLFDLLFGGAPTVRWAAAGTLPAGYRRADQFALLRAAPGRTFVLSLGARRGASSALTSYNALRSGRTRVARRVLGLGLRAGLVQPLLQDKIDIGVMRGATSAELAENLLGDHLQHLFGRRAGCHGGRQRQWPILQARAANLRRQRGAARVHQGGLERLDPRGGQPRGRRPSDLCETPDAAWRPAASRSFELARPRSPRHWPAAPPDPGAGHRQRAAGRRDAPGRSVGWHPV